MARHIEVICPCCSKRIVVETDTRRTWPSDKIRKKKGEDEEDTTDVFEEALHSVHESGKNAEDRFRQALDDEAKKPDKLDEAFRKAKEEADKNPLERPPNPLDWD